MVLKSTGSNVPVYQISGANASRSLPDWLIRKRKRALKNDDDFQNRVTLIQDFEFEEASNRIKLTRDGQYALATGVYKPQIHVYDFSQLSLKFDRHTDAENVDFEIVSDDWQKTVHLQTDRSIEFHTPGGVHFKTRIPKFGRSLAYNRSNCDVYVGGSTTELFRLNLDQGRFLAPFEGDADINTVKINQAHGLVGTGCENGTVEFWDPRARQRVGVLAVGGQGHGIGSGVTSIGFSDDGLGVAAGTFEGETKLFDLRSSNPLLVKDQGYGFPIKNIEYIKPDLLYSADKRSLKLWNNTTTIASLEPSVDINDVAYVPDSGMFLFANEGIPMHAYYVPAVGPAPSWCSFLDSITEELEEKPATSVYENFRFVTTKELKQLNLGHLVGSNVVKSYMHGYFIDQRLYEEAKLISDPFAHREHREREIRKKIEAERESRIRGTASTKKVNKAHDAPVDDRFKALFEDPDFEIDTNSREYKLRNGGKAGVAQPGPERSAPRGRTAAEQEDDEATAEDSSSSEDEKPKPKRKERKKKRRAEPEMAALQLVDTDDVTFGERKQKVRGDEPTSRGGPVVRGATEITFTPKAKKVEKKYSGDNGRTSRRNNDERRRASNNAFRGL